MSSGNAITDSATMSDIAMVSLWSLCMVLKGETMNYQKPFSSRENEVDLVAQSEVSFQRTQNFCYGGLSSHFSGCPAGMGAGK